MEAKILVAYATTHGSTQEVAEAVASALRHREMTVDLLPLRSVRSLAGYQAVVLGAPIYMFHVHKDLTRFLSQHRKELSQGLPVAIFAGGPFGEDLEKELQDVRAQFEKELAQFPWLKPAAVEIVGGKHDPAHLRFPWNLIPALRQMPPADRRDWNAIQAWASSLPEQLQPAAA